ncbi:DUF3102 domain-containing protein [Aerococcaceae bacterium DSM 111176]|nr:DUF3102 domain-containing protein [Aerococcaceae bacterium DSM 111176]
MNPLMLSNSVGVIETEINMYKDMAGKSIWEIGRRLNHVKEQDLTHGDFLGWLEKIGIERRSANRMMRIARELKENETTLSHLGLAALDLIASLPEEDRNTPHLVRSGELKEVSDMTVRELRELKQGDTKQTEQTQPSQPTDESQRLHKALIQKDEEIARLQGRYNHLSKQYEQVLSESEEVIQKANQLDHVKKHVRQEPALNPKLTSTINITELNQKVNDLLTVISPIRYQVELEQLAQNSPIYAQYNSIVERISTWCKDMKNILNQPVVIDGEYFEYKGE